MCTYNLFARVSRSFLFAFLISVALVSAAPVYAQSGMRSATAQPVSDVSREKIEQLVAPVALYPDALLAQVLTAAAYPGDIVRAARWLSRNTDAVARQDFVDGDAQKWDPSVKALLRFPTVLEKMSADLDWTTELGEVFVNQPQDVAAVVQSLREQATSAGVLQSNTQHRIRRARDLDRDVIIIESVDPDVIYVPYYDPVLVYRSSPSVAQVALITFGSAVIIRSIIKTRDPWNWRTGAVYRPFWPGYRVTRPSATSVQAWRPDPRRFTAASMARPAAMAPALRRPVATRGGTYARRAAVSRPVVSRPAVRQSYVRRSTVRSSVAMRPAVRAPVQSYRAKKPSKYHYTR